MSSDVECPVSMIVDVRFGSKADVGASQSASCPLYPQKQTLELNRVMSALCQKRTFEQALVKIGRTRFKQQAEEPR